MFYNPQSKIRNPQWSRSRGSVLIFVVALLTLIALIGTALVTTARIDRHNSSIHVQTTTDDATHQRFNDLLKQKVLSAILRGYGRDIDSARADTWLGDRLPIPVPAATPVANLYPASQYPGGAQVATDTPMWRFPSGIIDRYDVEIAQSQYWRPPFQYTPSNPVTLLDTATSANSIVKIDGTNHAALVPSSISITYPNDHPEESIRGKTRTFPAGFFIDRATGATPVVDPGVSAGSVAAPLMMGDADGDGIADSMLFQLAPSSIDGVTYYGAIRVVDNNSAINVNTAWLRTGEINTKPFSVTTTASGYDSTAIIQPTATTGANNGFFTSDIGLFELLDPAKYNFVGANTTAQTIPEGSGREARANEMAELDEYRLGYQIAGIHTDISNFDGGGWCDAFEDNINNPDNLPNFTARSAAAIRPMYASFNNGASTFLSGSLVALEDISQDPGDPNSATNPYNPDPDGASYSDSIGNYQESSGSPSTGSPDSLVRQDFTFTTQNEALATMSSRRWASIVYGVDLRNSLYDTSLKQTDANGANRRDALFPTAAPFNLDKTQGDELYANKPIGTLSKELHSLMPYRWFTDQDGTSLAYRFCLIDPNGNQATLDQIFRHSAYRAAPNWKPGLSDANPTWNFFPANEYLYWFQTLNFDGATAASTPPSYSGTDSLTGTTYPVDIAYTETKSYADSKNPSSLANSQGGKPRFRSVRPLLTTNNAVNTSLISSAYLYGNNYPFKYDSANTAFTGIDWNRNDTATAAENAQIYPGMLLTDMVTLSGTARRVPENWNSGIQYSLNDLVYDPSNRITWMCIKDAIGSKGVSPWSVNAVPVGSVPTVNFDTNTREYEYWEPQSWVSGKSKASVNTAGFPELWHAYFSAMTTGAPADSSVDTNLKTEIDNYTTGANGYPTIAPFTKNLTDDYAFFPVRASEPGTAAAGTTISDPDVFFLRYYDPSRGMRFHITDNTGRTVVAATGLPDPSGSGLDPTFDPAIANYPEPNGMTLSPAVPVYETNTLGMFRSVIRDPRPVRPIVSTAPDASNPDEYLLAANATTVTPASVTNAFNTINGTGGTVDPQERLTPFQMATLRSAIAAFNTQDMLNVYGLRDNGADPTNYNVNDVPAKTIVLYDTTREYPNPAFNAATKANSTAGSESATNYPGPDSPRPQYEVTIYGNRPQPFISEVFATNDSHPYTFGDPHDRIGGDASKLAMKQYQNPNGYVAIELYNPYSATINTSNWVISAINRNSDTGTGDFGKSTHVIGGTMSSPISFASMGIPSIGPHSFVVIDSYNNNDPSTDHAIAPPPSDPTTSPFATRQYRAPGSGLVPLYERPPGADNNARQAADKAFWAADPSADHPIPEADGALNPDDNSVNTQFPIHSAPGLTNFITSTTAKELIILRPRKTTAAAPTTTAELNNCVPIDQFDFTGMPTQATNACLSIHYARNTNGTNGWQVIYPGRYDIGRADPTKSGYGPRRYQGTWVSPPTVVGGSPIYDPATRLDPWISTVYHTSVGNGPFTNSIANARYGAMTFGQFNGNSSTANLSTITFSLVGGNPAFNQSLLIPLAGYPLAYNPMITAAGVSQNNIQHPVSPAQTTNQFPFGGFARNGDILQVPFIAAYRIRKFQSVADASVPPRRTIGITGLDGLPGVNPGQLDTTYTTNILEMNSISMDAALAEDTNLNNDSDINVAGESVGHFNTGASPASTGWPAYSWASNLFRYLDVHNPSSDFLPDANPAFYPPGSSLANSAAKAHQLPKPVNNRPGLPNLSVDPASSPTSTETSLLSLAPTDEDAVGSQGLININTAPRKVLSMLPIVPNAAGAIDVPNTQAAATDIFNYVTNTGDIKSLFDLNRVSVKFNGLTGYVPYAPDQLKQGDVYPVFAGAGVTGSDAVPATVKQQYLLMNRISNLVTTKSDTFTVYLLVQGWREAGTQFPVLDWEQRQAYIVDRSTGTLRVTKVPTD